MAVELVPCSIYTKKDMCCLLWKGWTLPIFINNIATSVLINGKVLYTRWCPVIVPHTGGKFVAGDPMVGPVVSTLSVLVFPQSPVAAGGWVETK